MLNVFRPPGSLVLTTTPAAAVAAVVEVDVAVDPLLDDPCAVWTSVALGEVDTIGFAAVGASDG